MSIINLIISLSSVFDSLGNVGGWEIKLNLPLISTLNLHNNEKYPNNSVMPDWFSFIHYTFQYRHT